MTPFFDFLHSGRARTLWSLARYLLTRLLTIGATIFVGVFLTVLIMNQPLHTGRRELRPQLDAKLESQIERIVSRYALDYGIGQNSDPDGELAALRARLRRENGLDLPFWPRHLLWTLNALGLNWGALSQVVRSAGYGQIALDFNVRDVVLEAFPNTLLLISTAYLVVFLLGLPLALRLARLYHSLPDRLLALAAPLSAVPSWVFGVLLISIFAVELRWLPVGGMYDTTPPETTWGYVGVIARHAVLPVLAIVLSLLFQLVSTWRTFFVIHSEEDYVDLARAKGLRESEIEHRYILKPTLPFVITSFSLSLVNFWQMTMAMEIVFRWPGLGWLYITRALPNFWGESVYPGELLVALNIVVIFAYLLGALVFLMDIVYALVDPRIHLLHSDDTIQRLARAFVFRWRGRRRVVVAPPVSVKRLPGEFLQGLRDGVREVFTAWWGFWRELLRYPSALFGLLLIFLMVVGSVYAFVAFPYEKIGYQWDSERLRGRAYVPKVAEPAWTNWFRPAPQLSVLRMDESTPSVSRLEKMLEDGVRQVQVVYTFHYAYGDFPKEMFLYLDTTYQEKAPFLTLLWVTPDGREINLNGAAALASGSYDFDKNIPVRKFLLQDENWRKWFNTGQVNATPVFHLLFATPGQAQPIPLRGQYQLKLNFFHFEAQSALKSELVLLGQVFGPAGTDYLRRDLIVPLLWGMPFALFFGLLGATLTTLLAMLLGATGVWFGGWVDALIQRLTEANMVLPVLAVSVLAYTLFGIPIWAILAAMVFLNVFGAPVKAFRAAFLQVKQAPYIESARAYGVSNARMISHYMIPRIVPVLVPQLVSQIPGFVFLEATLGLFNIRSIYPTWGAVIYQGLQKGALYGSRFWVLEPIALLLLTSLAFSLLGVALERILNPRLLEK